MKFFIVISSALAFLAFVHCFYDRDTSDEIAEILADAQKMKKLSNNPEFKADYQMILDEIEIVKALNEFESVPPMISNRHKRQVTTVNCTALQIQLADAQKQIANFNVKITNTTITLNTFKTQVAKYTDKVANSFFVAKIIAQSLLNLYQKLFDAAKATLATLEKELLKWLGIETKVKNDIQILCIMSTTTQRPTVSTPCGSFVNFDPINDIKGPELDGFVGGVTILGGSATYVAFGNGSSCDNQFLVPCALTTNSPGCSIPCSTSETILKSSIYYLQKNQNLVWVPTTLSTLSSVPDTIKILGPNNLRFGRALINGAFVLGKVEPGKGFYPAGPNNGIIQFTTIFEVLTCSMPCTCDKLLPVTPGSNLISAGLSLLPGGSIVSTDGSSLTLQTDGNIVIKNPLGQVTFTSNTTGTNPTSLTMDPSGSLNLKNAAGITLWSTGQFTPILIPGSSAKIIDGKLVIFNGNQTSFNSDLNLSILTTLPSLTTLPTIPTISTLPSISDTLNVGQSILPGGSIVSPDGSSLTLQTDGNIVIKNPLGQVTFTSNTNGTNPTSLTMDPSGSLNLKNAAGTTIWSTGQFTPTLIPGSSAKIIDGKLVVFNGNQISFNSNLNLPTLTTLPILTTLPTIPSISDTLSVGQSIFPGGSIKSTDGSSLTLQTDGNIVIKNPLGQVTFTSNTNGTNPTSLTMDPSGSLNLINAAGTTLWSTGQFTSTLIPGSSAKIIDGKLVIFNGNQTSFNSNLNIPTLTTLPILTTLPTISDTLNVGQSILPGGSIVSPDGSSLTLQTDGNIVIKNPLGQVTFTSNTNGTNPTSLTMDPNGSLNLKNAAGTILWSTGQFTPTLIPGSSAKIIDGKLVVFNGNQISFNSNLNLPTLTTLPILTTLPTLPSISDTLSVGQSILPGGSIKSTDGSSLTFQTDGNIVIKNPLGQVTFTSNTNGTNPTSLIMDPSGSLNLKNAAGTTLWSTGQFTPTLIPGSSAKIIDGKLVVFNGNQISFNSNLNLPTLTTLPILTTLPTIPSISDTLSVGQSIFPGGSIKSTDGSSLTLQTDGNIVIKNPLGQVTFTSNTNGTNPTSLTMDPSGSLNLINAAGTTLWSTGQFTSTLIPGSSAKIIDGKLVIFNGNQTSFNSNLNIPTLTTLPILTTLPTISDTLNVGQSILPGGSIVSPDGSSLTLQTDGNIVIKNPLGQVTFTSNTNGTNPTSLTMDPNGSLNLKNAAGTILWSTGQFTPTLIPGSSAKIIDGKLVVFNGNQISFNSNLNLPTLTTLPILTTLPTLPSISDTLSVGQSILPGGSIKSTDGSSLTFQTDGNIVIKNPLGQVTFTSNTNGTNPTSLIMDPSGSLNLKNAAGTTLWSTGQFTPTLIPGSSAKIIDGKLVVFNGNQISFNSDSLTSTSAPTLATTSSPTIMPCGTALDYPPNDPSISGFLSGVYKDGSNIYPGYGFYSACSGNRPARITMTSPTGGYSICGNTEPYNSTAKFFAAHSDLVWVTTNSKMVKNEVGIIHVTDIDGDDKYVTRHSLTGFQTIGAYWPGAIDSFYYDNGLKYDKGTYEVLACQKKVTCPISTCGTFIKYDIVNGQTDPSQCGFKAGTYHDGSAVYVGYAANSQCADQTNVPARIKIQNSNPGGYVERCGTEGYEPNTAYYLQNNENLKWVSASASNVLQIPNPLSIVGGGFTFYFARVNSSYNFVPFTTIGKGQVVSSSFTTTAPNVFWYYTEIGKEQEALSYEILTCAPPSNVILNPGVSITAGSSKTSPDGSSITLDSSGNIIVKDPSGTTTWTSKTSGSNATNLKMNENGSLVLTDSSGKVVWSSDMYTGSSIAGSTLSLVNGALVIAKDGQTSFNTATNPCPNLLGSGQSLNVGESRTSCNGAYKLTLKADGELILLSTADNKVIWKSETSGSNANKATMQTDGNFVLTDSTGKIVYQTKDVARTISGSALQVSDNGQFIIGSGNDIAFIGRERPAYSCGTFLQYDIVRDKGGPIVEGFSAGTYADGTSVFVGYAANTPCNDQTIVPARIKAVDPNPGGYVGRCGTEAYEPNTAYYLQKNNNLVWVKTTKDTFLTVNNALAIKGGVFTFYFARVNMTSSNTVYTQIGKSEAAVDPGSTYTPGSTYALSYSSNTAIEALDFEILTCMPEPSTTTNAPTSSVMPPCGTLVTFKGNDPALNGKVAGKYIDGSTIFAGIGNFSMCYGQNPAPARIMTTNTVSGPGAYCSCGGAQPAGENYDGTSAQYFYNHPDLKWIPTTADKASTVVGAVKVAQFYVGRKFMPSFNGTYQQVGKIESNQFRYKNPGKLDEWIVSGDIDVLACVPCPNGGSGPFCCANGANNKECLLEFPCGTTAAFPRNDPNVDGFNSGFYQDGTKVFPGVGDFSGCWGQKDGAGRVLAEFIINKEPGAYQICGGAPERLDYSDPRYFIKHPSLTWVQTTAAEAINIPGVIKTGSMPQLIGRFNYITPTGVYQTIGKVHDSQLYFYQPGDNGETITSGAIEVLTCQPREPVIQCGTLLQLTVNNITALGFESGTYIDGSTVYVGTGNMGQCFNQNPSPARISILQNFKGPGAYMVCGNNVENYDEIDPRFFAKHENLRWIPTNGSSYAQVEGIIKIGAFYAGRVNITITNGTYQQIGKIEKGQIYYKQPITGQEIISGGAFEVLACTSCPYAKLPSEPCCTNGGRGMYCCLNGANNVDCCANGGSGKFCCLNGANNPECINYSCGTLLKFIGNDPSINGFSAGKYIDGSTIYAGIGNFSMCWWQNPAPARIMTTNSVSGPGAYCSCGGAQPAGENYDGTSAQYYYNHPDLKWVPTTPSQAANVVGAVKVAGFYVGRKFMISANGTYQQVGKIEGGSLKHKIPGKTSEFDYYGDIDVLACVPCTNGGSGPFCCTNGANNPTCDLNPPCGTLLSYPRNDPTVDGLPSGTYYNGAVNYPGTADFSACFGQNPGVARVDLNGFKGAGGYMVCGNPIELFDDMNVKYYKNNPALKWIPVNTALASTVPGVLKVGPWNMNVARKTFTVANGTFTAFGKIESGKIYYYIPETNIETVVVTDVEVLACQP